MLDLEFPSVHDTQIFLNKERLNTTLYCYELWNSTYAWFFLFKSMDYFLMLTKEITEILHSKSNFFIYLLNGS